MKVKSIFFILVLLLITACGNEVDQPQEPISVEEDVKEVEVVDTPKLNVYTTIFPLFDFTKKIGGDYVHVANIVPVGADAHTYELSPKMMVDVSQADLYIYNGAGIEGFAHAVADVLQSSNVKIVKATEGVQLIGYDHGIEEDLDHDHGHSHSHDDPKEDHKEHEHEHGEEDPHVWLDPIRSIELAENIKNSLVELLPEAKDVFEANFQSLKAELEQLDKQFQEMVNETSKNAIVVSHAGYGYWTERYGIKQVGISGISPTNEPSIKQMKKVIEFIQHENINYILFEQNIPTNISETVRSQADAESLTLHNLEALVQEDVTANEDYFTLMNKNIETLRKALN